MAGYSQGAMLVHNAATQLGETAGSVKAAVTFGDPCMSILIHIPLVATSRPLGLRLTRSIPTI